MNLLDPRTFPIADIAHLVHALPPLGAEILVADLPGADAAVDWLNAHGRPARLVPAPGDALPTRLWNPSPGLVPILEHLVPQRALDLGCGTGRDAVYLAMQGWQVTAVDRLPDALDRARSLADLHGVQLELVALDTDRDPLPVGPFDLVTAFRFLLPFSVMVERLRSGGSLVIETFTDRERERTGKPRDANLVLPSAGPPLLPEGVVLRDYDVRVIEGRELACLWAVAD